MEGIASTCADEMCCRFSEAVANTREGGFAVGHDIPLLVFAINVAPVAFMEKPIPGDVSIPPCVTSIWGHVWYVGITLVRFARDAIMGDVMTCCIAKSAGGFIRE